MLAESMLAEKCKKFSKYLYLCFVDYQKAFDSICREVLWHVMEHLGYEGKIIRLLKTLYKKTFSMVRVDGEFTNWFQTVVGVMQECVLSPFLFCVYFEVVTARALGRRGSDSVRVTNQQLKVCRRHCTNHRKKKKNCRR